MMFRMGRQIARSIHRNMTGEESVDVSESKGVRALHLGSDTVQSAMRVNDPYALELRYSRAMMMFLLFNPQVRDVLVLGLGGGSIPKYIYKHLPAVSTRVVEINPRIIQVARSHFYVPDNDERFEIIEGDAVSYLRDHPATTNMLMMDAFASNGLPPELCSQDFFDSCADAVTAEGMCEINLWGSDKNYDVYLQRIERSFEQRVLVLPTGHPGNVIVLCFKRPPNDLRWSTLRVRAKALEAEYKVEFLEFVERLREHNPGTSNRLFLG